MNAAGIAVGGAATYECVKRVKQAKKLCAGAFSDDGEHVFFANKYGDVNVLPTAAPTAAGAVVDAAALDAVGPGRYCPQRHPPHCRLPFLEVK